jgi:hypothetical protein
VALGLFFSLLTHSGISPAVLIFTYNAAESPPLPPGGLTVELPVEPSTALRRLFVFLICIFFCEPFRFVFFRQENPIGCTLSGYLIRAPGDVCCISTSAEAELPDIGRELSGPL